MNPPSSEIKPNLPPAAPEEPAELKMPPVAKVTQPEAPPPTASPPPAKAAPAPTGQEIDLGPTAPAEISSELNPQTEPNMARILAAEPEDTQGLADLAGKVYPDTSA